jgi:hypothetical protein
MATPRPINRSHYSLRALLALTAIIAFLAAILAREIHSIRAEAAAGRELNAIIQSADGRHQSLSSIQPDSASRAFLYRIAGSPGEVQSLTIGSAKSLDALVQRRRALPNLREVKFSLNHHGPSPSFMGTLTSDHVKSLSTIRSIETLEIEGKPTLDLSIAELSDLPHLKYLKLYLLDSSDVSPTMIEQIGKLKSLWSLDLYLEFDAKIPPRAFAPLQNLDSLDMLSILGGDIGDEALEVIARIPHLRSLQLNVFEITDKGLQAACTRLHLYHLRISSSDVTDASIEALAGIKELKFLDINGTRISPEGISRLRALRPELNIEP